MAPYCRQHDDTPLTTFSYNGADGEGGREAGACKSLRTPAAAGLQKLTLSSVNTTVEKPPAMHVRDPSSVGCPVKGIEPLNDRLHVRVSSGVALISFFRE
ncbi:hypothetical protein GOP47_0021335, partial [Adiantum capillus-veneris]